MGWRKLRILLGLLAVLAIGAAWASQRVLPRGRTFYASPDGGGSGTSRANPFHVRDFLELAQPGDTLYLLDGVYVGQLSMLYATRPTSGTAGDPIVVKALNDGAVRFDGEGLRKPVYLGYADYWILEGFDACNSSESVVELSYSNHCQIRRVCAWDAAEGNSVVFTVHFGDNNLLEDCAGWGRSRKIFSASQNGNHTTFRRCFGRFEACISVGNKMTFSVVYNNYDCLLENCIATWDTSTGRMPEWYVLQDFDRKPFMRIPTDGVSLPGGGKLKGNYRPNGMQNGQPRWVDYYACDAYVYLWYSDGLGTWVVSEGSNSGPQMRNYWVKQGGGGGPEGTYSPTDATSGNLTVESCTYDNWRVGEGCGLFGAEGYWGEGWNEDSRLRMRGCIAYLLADQRADAFPGLFFMTTTSEIDLEDCASYVAPGAEGRYRNGRIRPYYLMPNRDDHDGTMGLAARNLTAVGPSSYIDRAWDVSSLLHHGAGPLPMERTARGGANIHKRYVDGELTDQDLWPWPMDQRIHDAMLAGGCKDPISVTDTIRRISSE